MADETSPLLMPPNRRGGASVTPFLTSVNTAADDMRPLLTRVYSEPQLSSSRLQTDSGDFKSRRPFHVKPQNIVNSDDDAQERVSAQVLALNKRIQYYGKLSAADLSLVPPDHVIPAPDEIYVYSPLGTAFKVEQPADGVGKNPSIVTIFTIWNTMMGTSILSMPWGIKQAGFTFGIILIFLMGLLTLYCCYRVLTSRKTISDIDTSTWEFPDVCKFYFGSFGQWSSLLFSMISLVGAMIVYWVLMSNFLFNTGIFIYDFVHNINMTDNVPSTNGSEKVICPYPEIPKTDYLIVGPNNSSAEQTAFAEWWSKTKTVPFYLVVLILPLLNFKSASFFARFNVLGTISVVYLVILVTLKAARLGFHLEFHWFDSKADTFFVPEFRVLFPQLTGVLTLAFFIHNCIITLLKSNKNQENNVRDLSIAYLLVCLTYLYVGVLIFASFPSPPLSKDCIEPNFLDNFPSGDIMAVIARVFLLFQMTTVYPLLGYLVRVQLLGQLFGKTYPSVFHVLILNILVVGAGVAMAQLYPNIGGIIRYSGATCGLAFVFVYPSVIHIIALYRQEQLRWHSVLLHGLLIIAGLANLIAQFIT